MENDCNRKHRKRGKEMIWTISYEPPVDPPSFYENTDCSSLECESGKYWYHCPEDKKIWYAFPKQRGNNRCSECWMMRGFNRECICDLISEADCLAETRELRTHFFLKEGWYD